MDGRRDCVSDLDKEEVVRLAKLARLALTDAEVERLTPQLAQVVAHIDKINELDTDAVPATSHATGETLPLREDREGQSLPVQTALENAPAVEDGYVVVPRILAEH